MSFSKRGRESDERSQVHGCMLMNVSKEEVPAYLHSGEFYQSLQGGDDDNILIPRDCFQRSPDITNGAELESLLKTLRFWVVTEIPDALLDYACAGRAEYDESIYEQFERELPYLEIFKTIGKKANKLLCSVPDVRILRYLLRQPQPIPRDCVNAAASGGHLESLKLLHEHGGNWGKETCAGAAKQGHFACLKYLHENGCPWDEQTYFAALAGKHVECVIYALRNGCDREDDNFFMLKDPAKHLQVLQCVCDLGIPWDYGTAGAAAGQGYLDSIIFLHEHGCEWYDETINIAAGAGSLECVKYTHEHGCVPDDEIFIDAVNGGNIEVLKYLVEANCPYTPRCTIQAVRDNKLEMLKYLTEHGCAIHSNCMMVAATRNNLEILTYLYESGQKWEKMTCRVQHGYLEVLKYAHEHGCHMDVCTALFAAQKGHAECLEYALANGFARHKNTCVAAAEGGHLECLMIAHKYGCPWNESTTRRAATTGKLECLKYLHENGCPWGSSLTAAAGKCERNKVAACLQYAVEHGCPTPKKRRNVAKRGR